MVQSTDPEIWLVAGEGAAASTFSSFCFHVPPNECWDIDTKYYTARAILRPVDASDEASQPNVAVHPPAALVLIASCAEHASFLRVQHWFGEVLRRVAAPAEPDEFTAVAEVQLLALELPGPAHEPAPWLKEALDWARQRLIEVVFYCADDPAFDTALGGADGLLLGNSDFAANPATQRLANTFPDCFSDSMGKSRILQALYAHQWPGLQLKPKRGGASAAATGAAAASAGPGEYVPPTLPSERATEGAASASERAAASDTLEGSQGDDEHLDLLMGQLMRFRDAVGGGRMSDSERKDAAEHMALRLLAALGGDEDEDGNEEDAL